MTTPSEDNSVLDLPSTTSLEDMCSSNQGFDGWLDDLYDANGIFNEDLGVQISPSTPRRLFCSHSA